jgi:hypothetical protein
MDYSHNELYSPTDKHNEISQICKSCISGKYNWFQNGDFWMLKQVTYTVKGQKKKKKKKTI